ncbi:hypothetical protein WAI453_012716 [Rhynchosporium graminicola]
MEMLLQVPKVEQVFMKVNYSAMASWVSLDVTSFVVGAYTPQSGGNPKDVQRTRKIGRGLVTLVNRQVTHDVEGQEIHREQRDARSTPLIAPSRRCDKGAPDDASECALEGSKEALKRHSRHRTLKENSKEWHLDNPDYDTSALRRELGSHAFPIVSSYCCAAIAFFVPTMEGNQAVTSLALE